MRETRRRGATLKTSPTSLGPLVFERPSRSGGPAHRVYVDPRTLVPGGCSCPAGAHGHLCHAVLEVAADEAYWAAWERMLEAERQYGHASPQQHIAAAVVRDAATRAVRAQNLLDERAQRTRRKAA